MEIIFEFILKGIGISIGMIIMGFFMHFTMESYKKYKDNEKV